jgi:hypothetical protein
VTVIFELVLAEVLEHWDDMLQIKVFGELLLYLYQLLVKLL